MLRRKPSGSWPDCSGGSPTGKEAGRIHPSEKSPVALASVCITARLPDCGLSEITPEEYENGARCAVAEQRLVAAGYEELFVRFVEADAPAFLLPAVLSHVGVARGAYGPNYLNPKEE
jgi:hypothetical protein